MERAAPHAYPAPVRRQRPHSILADNAFPVWDGATATRTEDVPRRSPALMAATAQPMTNARRPDAKERRRIAATKFIVTNTIASLQSASLDPVRANASISTMEESSASSPFDIHSTIVDCRTLSSDTVEPVQRGSTTHPIAPILKTLLCPVYASGRRCMLPAVKRTY